MARCKHKWEVKEKQFYDSFGRLWVNDRQICVFCLADRPTGRGLRLVKDTEVSDGQKR